MIKIRCKNCIASPSGDMHEADPREVLEALDQQAPEVLRDNGWFHADKIAKARWSGDGEIEWKYPVVKHVRPWGYFEVLAEGPSYKVKRLVIDPGKRTSLQWHEKRDEAWIPVTMRPAWETPYKVMGAGFNFPIMRVEEGQYHRIDNTEGTEPLVVVEVQTFDPADPSGEDDIHRIEDDYGRAEGGES